ncbi:MAG: AMP-binding protein [Alphaproteobacteria bacterium]|nr:AMP-binding protein [Alphaproteobacteria bacterium]
MIADKSKWTLVNLVRHQAEHFGEREFISFEQGPRLTFAALDRDTDDLALRLRAVGVVPGDRVMALVKNRVEFLLSLIATNKLGAIFVPINTELKGAFLQHQLHNASPRVVLVDAELVPAFSGVGPGDEQVGSVVVIAGAVPAAMPAVFAGARQMSFDELAAMPPVTDTDLAVPEPHDISCIMYTSGTTGPSKGVLMPHAHMYLGGYGVATSIGMNEDDCYYICMPLFHGNALMMQTIATLISGGRAHVVERFSPNRWLEEVRACGATLTNALGVMPEFIFRSPAADNDSDNNLRIVMAVPVAEEWAGAFEARFGVQIIQGFGMTECNMVAYSNPGDPLVAGCAGHILDDFFEVRIVNTDTDLALPNGEVGEIVVRPKLPSGFMVGYYKMPERTVEAWRNLWFHSGDAGKLDDQGQLHFVDRIKDCIRRRGENISSFEVEQVLNNHPCIAESAVIGVKTADAGGEEEVMAVIVGRGEVDNTTLLDYCVDLMPRYAVPRFVVRVAALDKTPTGKLQKQALRDAGVTADTWDRETVGYKIARR